MSQNSSRFTPLRVALLSFFSNFLLMAVKLTTGYFSGSRALMADGIHSATDLPKDLAIMWSIRASSEPPDESHPYGHQRFESLVSLLIAFLIIIAALYMIYDNVRALAAGKPQPITSWSPVIVAAAAMVLKEILYRISSSVSKKHDSASLMANAWDHRADAFSEIPVAAGVAVAIAGGPDWRFIDSLAGVVLGTIVILAAGKLFMGSAKELTDHAPSAEIMDTARTILEEHEGVKDFHAIRGRTMGGKIEMDFHILVNPELSVREGHNIATEVENAIRGSLKKSVNVNVHVEPEGE